MDNDDDARDVFLLSDRDAIAMSTLFANVHQTAGAAIRFHALTYCTHNVVNPLVRW